MTENVAPIIQAALAIVEPPQADPLLTLNAVTLTPEQFEQEAIELSKKLEILCAPYTGAEDEKDFIDLTIKKLGPQFSFSVLEQVVKFYKEQVTDITQNKLVAMLKTINAKKWVAASNGMEVSLVKKYSLSLTKADKALLAGWLEARSLGYLITDNLAFEKGQLTPDIVAELRTRGFQFVRDSEVNTASLKTVLVARAESGEELPPPEACAMSDFELAEIKFPRSKKK